MNARTFVDTNVLVYLFDRNNAAKQKVAKKVLDELWSERAGVVSVQVLQEFYLTVTKKIGKPLTTEAAREVVHLYTRWCRETTPSVVAAAFRIEDEAKKMVNTTFIVGAPFSAFAVQDGNLITGQQQNSGAAAAKMF